MARYFLRFRHSDTGLTPTFLFFKKAADLSNIVAPSIGEVSGGTYYFDFTPTFDIIFEVDGGVSIPTEEIRYVSDTISHRDVWVDEPISQVKDDVWNDVVDRTAGSKGEFVESIGVPADTSAQSTVFGKMVAHKESIRGDTADTSDGNDVEQVYDVVVAAQTALGLPSDNSAAATLFGKTLLYKESIRGDTAGTSDGNDVEQVFDSAASIQTDTDDIQAKLGVPTTTIAGAVDAINVETDAASIANAVWNEALAGHTTAGTTGKALTDVGASAGSGAAIAASVWSEDLTPYNTANTAGKLSKDTQTAVDAINIETDAASIANAVWDEVLTGHIAANSGGDIVTRVFKILKNRTKIDATADTLTVYDDDGTTLLYEFDLKDKTGAPSGEKPFERVPIP